MNTKILYWLILGTEGGGLNRAIIIKQLKEKPSNINQLKKKLNVNRGTIQHHIDILEKYELIESTKEKYNKMYFLSEQLEKEYYEFNDIWLEIEKRIKQRRIKNGIKSD
jgi:predicted transcriptional regulator